VWTDRLAWVDVASTDSSAYEMNFSRSVRVAVCKLTVLTRLSIIGDPQSCEGSEGCAAMQTLKMSRHVDIFRMATRQMTRTNPADLDCAAPRHGAKELPFDTKYVQSPMDG